MANSLSKPVIVMETGGKPVVQVDEQGVPATVVDALGQGITLVEAQGTPMVLWNPDGTGYSDIDEDAVLFFEALTTPPTAERQDLYNDLIVGLKADDDWDSLDWLLILAAEDGEAGRTNIRNPAKVLAAINSPTFTIDRGYEGDEATSSLAFGEVLDAAGNSFALNSATIAAWCNEQNGTGGSLPHFSNDGAVRYFLSPRGDGASSQFRMNDASTALVASATRLGDRFVVREGAAVRRVYLNGNMIVDDTIASTSLTASQARLLSNTAVFCADRLSAALSGSKLVPAAVARVRARVNTFLSAIGA